jgi:hypothetical protein
MDAEQVLRDYVAKHLSHADVTIECTTSSTHGSKKLIDFKISGSGLIAHKKLARWSKQDELMMVEDIKSSIDTFLVKQEKERITQSILDKTAEILTYFEFNVHSSYKTLEVYYDHNKQRTHGSKLLFKIFVNLEESVIVFQCEKFSRFNVVDESSPRLDLADPESLGDGIIEFVRNIAEAEADKRLEALRAEIRVIEDAKSELRNGSVRDAVKTIMPGFKTND